MCLLLLLLPLPKGEGGWEGEGTQLTLKKLGSRGTTRPA